MKMRNVCCGVLIFLTVFLLFAAALTRYYNRAWSIESQRLAQRSDQLKLDWERMQLEYSAHKTQSRVETMAWDQLKMRPLQEKEIYRVRVDE